MWDQSHIYALCQYLPNQELSICPLTPASLITEVDGSWTPSLSWPVSNMAPGPHATRANLNSPILYIHVKRCLYMSVFVFFLCVCDLDNNV